MMNITLWIDPSHLFSFIEELEFVERMSENSLYRPTDYKPKLTSTNNWNQISVPFKTYEKCSFLLTTNK